MRLPLPSLPILDWGRRYDRETLAGDLLAALIVTIMLIPQSLAYAMLAGLPPEVGLYASVAPLFMYALFGTSRVLAVGPVAVVSLMTAAAMIVGMIPMAIGGPGEEQNAALARAVIGGLLFATPTTLLIVPCLFAMLRKRNDGVAAYGVFEDLPNE